MNRYAKNVTLIKILQKFREMFEPTFKEHDKDQSGKIDRKELKAVKI